MPDDQSWRRDRSVYDMPTGPLPRAAYIHVPFCRHRCGYCDFTLVADREDLVGHYLAALSAELRELPVRLDVDSIFVGGGTPTHLSPSQLDELLSLIYGAFELSHDGEYTFEANPDGLSDQKIRILHSAGVNRISLGVQSFDQDILRTLERTHTPDEARSVLTNVQNRIPNVSLDLIFGVPGQDSDLWQQTLNTATSLSPSHISTYGLTYEKGTSFYRRRSQNEFDLVSDDTERLQYAAAISMLTDSGLQQYEISNFARPGYRCRHNEVYWDASEYFGFGPGAARYVNGVRSTNSRNVTSWIKSWTQGRPLLQDREELSAVDRAREAVFLGLRRNRGLPEGAFQARFGHSIESLAPGILQQYLSRGLLMREVESVSPNRTETWLKLTDEGRFLADSIVVDFL